MKLKHLASMLALAGATTLASAAVPSSIIEYPTQNVWETYSFAIGAGEAANAFVRGFIFDPVGTVHSSWQLWSSTDAHVGDSNDSFSGYSGFFNGVKTEIAGLTSGNYFFVVNTNQADATFTAKFVAAPAAPVPEPETYAMLLAGLGAVGFMARRRRFV